MGVVEILVEDARQEGIEKGIDLGIEKGIDLGIDLGVEKNKIETVKNILQKFPEWNDEMVADLANVSIETVLSIRNENH